MTHNIKIMDCYFDDVEKGIKTFEIRKNDRNYNVGDIVILRECFLYEGHLIETGRYVSKHITYILKDIPQYGLDINYIIFAMK